MPVIFNDTIGTSDIGVTVQGYDADLSAIASLTTTGAIERTGTGAASTFTVTTAAKTVLDDATTAAMLTTLGGQPLDSDLTAIAGLATTGAIERTGSGTASTFTVTAAGKALLDDATAGDMRTTLGIDPDYYKKSNILGTVTQSGGVPTGAVIEYGSNANGKYVRFADGTQICIRQEAITTGQNSMAGNWTFPAAFSSGDFGEIGAGSISVINTYDGFTTPPGRAKILSYTFASAASLGRALWQVETASPSDIGTSYVRLTLIGRWF